MASIACPGNFPQRMGEVARIASAHTGGNLAHPSLDVGEVSRPFSTLGFRTPPQISHPSGLLSPFYSHDLSDLACPLKSRDPVKLSCLSVLPRSHLARDSPSPSGLAHPHKSRSDPHPRAPRDARRHWGPRKRRGRRAPPPAPDPPPEAPLRTAGPQAWSPPGEPDQGWPSPGSPSGSGQSPISLTLVGGKLSVLAQGSC